MKLSNNLERFLELIDAAVESSKMSRIIYIENARAIISEFDKKEWQQLTKLSKSFTGIQFNMLITCGIKKPYRADIFKGRMERFD